MDLKAFSALSAYDMSVITALVAQDMRGVDFVHALHTAEVALMPTSRSSRAILRSIWSRRLVVAASCLSMASGERNGALATWATIFFSRAFSSSRHVRRCISSGKRPPYCFFQLKYFAWLIPAFRQIFATGLPCFRMNAFRASVPLPAGKT